MVIAMISPCQAAINNTERDYITVYAVEGAAGTIQTQISIQAGVQTETRTPIQGRLQTQVQKPILASTTTPSSVATPTPATEATSTPTPSPAPSTMVTVNPDYVTGMVTVSAGSGGSNKLYFSTDKMKTWELIEDSNVIDIRGILKPGASIIYFRGNKDPDPYKLDIPAESGALKASFGVNKETGVRGIQLTGAEGKAIEYRVTVNGYWDDYQGLDTTPFEVMGTTLQFRIKATPTSRAGKVVALKIPKRAKAPGIKVNGSKLTFTGLKSGGTEYRVNDDQSWMPYTSSDGKSGEVNIASFVKTSESQMGIPQNVRIPAILVEFRTAKTDKAQPSAIRTIILEEQRDAPTEATVTISDLLLIINDASKDKPYEILILSNDDTTDPKNAKWKSVTTSKPQSLTKWGSKQVVKGMYTLHVRLKAGKDKATGLETMASLYLSRVL